MYFVYLKSKIFELKMSCDKDGSTCGFLGLKAQIWSHARLAKTDVRSCRKKYFQQTILLGEVGNGARTCQLVNFQSVWNKIF